MSVRVTFHGAAGGVVTGSCFLVETRDHRLLIDCGLFQGSKALAERNYAPFPFDPRSIDAVLLTHAHIDHSGLLPKLVRQGFSGPIYTTPPTADLLEIMLPDSAHIQENEVERLNRRRQRQGKPLLTPIYTQADAARSCEMVHPIEMKEPLNLHHGLEATFIPAGHVLGAASIRITYREPGTDDLISIAFSGDLGTDSQTLLDAPQSFRGTEIVIMESTYGDRSRIRDENRYEKLAEIVRETFKRNGNVIIPAFAIGRSQEVLYGLHRLIRAGDLDPGQIFLDSPLAVRATDIFCDHIDSFDEEAQAFAEASQQCPLYLKELSFSRTPEESMAINRIRSGAVVLSASGMCEAGRIKHHLRHNLWRPECSIVFVGYQAEGTLGRRIQRGDKRVRIHGEDVRVRAQIHTLDGFSAHADQDELVEWAANLSPTPRKIYLVHGEEHARIALRDRLQSELGCEVALPLLGESIECTAERITQAATGERPDVATDASSLWLMAQELTQVLDQIEREGLPESDRFRLEKVLSEAVALAKSTLQRDE